ncbi:DKNYY domain-containing protein [Tenacibaculum sp. 190524A05c]|uniref:DKNYY domain-containing protein n=1 Tax=Tenacibaculum platacis TaxID=3137852 RepID=UPI0032B22C0B
MKKLVTSLILSTFLISCKNPKSNFERTNIVDRTIAYSKNEIKWIALQKNASIDGYTRIGDSIFGGEIACNIKPLKGIDIASFKVLPGTKYAKDKNNVYYPIDITCLDYKDCGVCYFSKIKLDQANSRKFKYLNKEYASDGKNVYFRGELIPNADGESFKVIDGPEFFFFATDKKHVYKHNEIFDEADSKTFHYKSEDKRNIIQEYEHKFIIGDETKEWEFIPPNTITRIKKENKKHADTISIDYLKHQKILDILKLLPKQTMTSWEWTQENRIKTVDFIEKNNFLVDSTKMFNNITYIKPNTLGIQVVDGFWTLSIYQLTSAKTLIITNDIVGDGKDINSFLFTENSFEKIEFNQLFGKGIKNLIKNQSEQCVLELEDNYFTFDYDFTDKNIVTFTSWGLEKDEHQNCFKGNVLEFELNTSEEKFELKSMFWKEN